MNNQNIYEAIVTGGPCSGKTTLLSLILQKLSDKGVKVFVRDEIATRFILGGITPWDRELHNSEFQRQLLLHTLESDARIRTIMSKTTASKKLIMYDRGVFDALAYIKPELFNKILLEEKLIAGELMGMSDAVIYLQTAAYGAEAFYTTINNKARTEALEDARRLDDLTQDAWIGHEHMSCITNEGKTFDQKMTEGYQKICDLLGIPVPIESERKFLIKPFSLEDVSVAYKEVHILQTYLTTTDGSEERVRRRTLDGGSTCYFTRKTSIPGSSDRFEIQHRIPERDYYTYIEERADHNYRPIRKNRYCFLWNNQYFEVDRFLDETDEYQLEWEGTDRNHILQFPPFIKVIKEVTEEKKYGNKERARIR